MDFRLTDDQLQLQEAVRTFCTREYALDAIGTRECRDVDRAAWSDLCELGVFALRADPADGGLGMGWMEAAVVYEVLGGHLVPGPLVWSQLAPEHVPGAAAGDVVVGGLDLVHDGGGALLVEHATALDRMLVLRADGVYVVAADEWSDVEPLPPLDPLTPVARVGALAPGRQVADAAAAAELRRRGAVLASALLVGIADRALVRAGSYALERHQFGRAIGSFQAVQHLLADMYVRTMLARSATYAAAALLDDPDAGDLDLAVSSAQVVAGDAAMANARACIQVHGGMGFTWEMLPHHLLKRTWVLEHSFATGVHHAELIAAAVGGDR